MRRATMAPYAIPAKPMRLQSAATVAAVSHGARRTADRSSTALKWTIVGVANAPGLRRRNLRPLRNERHHDELQSNEGSRSGADDYVKAFPFRELWHGRRLILVSELSFYFPNRSNRYANSGPPVRS